MDQIWYQLKDMVFNNQQYQAWYLPIYQWKPHKPWTNFLNSLEKQICYPLLHQIGHQIWCQMVSNMKLYLRTQFYSSLRFHLWYLLMCQMGEQIWVQMVSNMKWQPWSQFLTKFHQFHI